MNMTVSAAKAQADRIVARLKSLGVDIKRTQGLEAAAAANNFADWNRYLAHLAGESPRTLPIAASPRSKHTLLVFGPGKGKTWMLSLLCAEAMQRGASIPVYIDCNPEGKISLPARVTQNMAYLEAKFDSQGVIRHLETPTGNPDAIYIHLIGLAEDHSSDRAADAVAFVTLAEKLQMWPARLRRRIGPILVDDFQRIKSDHASESPDLFGTGSSEQIANALLMSTIDSHPMWHARASTFITALMRPLVYLRDHCGERLDINVIRNYFGIESLEALVYDYPEKYPGIEQSIAGIRDYVLSVPGYDSTLRGNQSEKTRELHNYIAMQFTHNVRALGFQAADVFTKALPMLANLAEQLIVSTDTIGSDDLNTTHMQWEVIVDVDPAHLSGFKTPDGRIAIHSTSTNYDHSSDPSAALEVARMVRNAVDKGVYPDVRSPRGRQFMDLVIEHPRQEQVLRTAQQADTYRISHQYDIGDQTVYIKRRAGDLDAARVAVYCQFKCEDWFGEGTTLSNLGIAALLVAFYGFKHTSVTSAESCHPIDMYSAREAACGDMYHELMQDKSLHRDDLKQFMAAFIDN